MNSFYTVNFTNREPSLEPVVGSLTAPEGWENAEVGEIAQFHAASDEERPRTFFRLLYDKHYLYVRFDVLERFVKVVETEPQSNVCGDSCVEAFIEPAGGKGYFNFEVNALGTMLLYHMRDSRLLFIDEKKSFRDFAPVDLKWFDAVERHGFLKSPVTEPIQAPLAWALAYKIPFALFTAHVGELEVKKGTIWRGNFFKCGGGSDHYGSWKKVGRALNFHRPEKFGELHFN